MSNGESGHRATPPDLSLNRRHALEMLDLDTLAYRAIRENVPIAYHRFMTALTAFRLVRGTGIFGDESDAYERELFNAVRTRVGFSGVGELGHELDSIPSQGEVSFPQAAAFIDIASDWVAADDLYKYFLHCIVADRPWRERPRRYRFVRSALELGHRLGVREAVRGALLPYLDFGKEDVARGFYDFLDLSVDIRMWLNKGEASLDWFVRCYGPWFAAADVLIERTIDYLRRYAVDSDANPTWELRRSALLDLQRFAWSSVKETQTPFHWLGNRQV